MSKIVLNEKYQPLITSDSRYFICTGGRGSAKSFSITYWCVLKILFEDGHTILFTRYTMKSTHISIIPEIVDKIKIIEREDDFIVTKDSIICKLTGSKILFKGIKTSEGDQTATLKSITGATIWIMDEAEELVDQQKFDTIDLSIRSSARDNKVILLLNPTTKKHWVYDRFFLKKGVAPGSNITVDDVTYIHTTYMDNIENLPESWIKQANLLKISNPQKYDHIFRGGWLEVAEGVIYTNWRIGEFPDMDYGYGMDFGFSNDPTTLTKVAIDNKLKKIYLDEILYESGLTTTQIFNSINNEVGDNLIIADSAEPRLIEELRQRGLNIRPCTKGAGSIVEGITLIQDYEIIVTPRSKNIMMELNNYVWSDKRSGTPKDMDNHSCDGFRYYISHSLKHKPIEKFRIYF